MTTLKQTVWHDLRIALEKFTALCDKENANHTDIVETRHEIERLEKILDQEVK